MKDTKQNTKEVKKFRLHSILKLHTRILNQKLLNHVIGLQSVVDSLLVADNVVDKKTVINQLIDLMRDFAVIGSHNKDVSDKANKLQLASSQEELQALFKLVTKSDADIIKEAVEEDTEKCKCNCTENKDKDSQPNTSKVSAKVIEIVASSKEEALEKFKQLIEEGKII